MARQQKKNGSNSNNKGSAANLGFEAKLRQAADKLRSTMDAAEYKHVVLGLIFLKYISDRFEQQRAKLVAGAGDYAGANAEDPDEYRAENVFWVPTEARWPALQADAKQSGIGKRVDDAMVAIERDNPSLKGVLPKDYARPALDAQRLGELIDLIGTIALVALRRVPTQWPKPSCPPTACALRTPAATGESDIGVFHAGQMQDGRPGDRRAGVVWHTQGSGFWPRCAGSNTAASRPSCSPSC